MYAVSESGFMDKGLYPCNIDAVSKRWLTVGEAVNQSASRELDSQDQSPQSSTCQPCGVPGCQSCGPRLAHAMVGRLVPDELADLLVPPLVPEKKTRVLKAVKTARVFTSTEVKVFVSRLGPDTEPTDVEQYLRDNLSQGLTVSSSILPTKFDSYTSFRVSVCSVDTEATVEVLSPSFGLAVSWLDGSTTGDPPSHLNHDDQHWAGLLYGRPYGGVAVLRRKALNITVSIVSEDDDRILALITVGLVLIGSGGNVHLLRSTAPALRISANADVVPTEADNYRSIAISSPLFKLFESVFPGRLQHGYLSTTPANQFGFKQHHGTDIPKAEPSYVFIALVELKFEYSSEQTCVSTLHDNWRLGRTSIKTRAEEGNQTAVVQIGGDIGSLPSFTVGGDSSSVAVRWKKWKRSFALYLKG
ncbi:hypothetical protein Bbelb_381690 [Branchiostoma belcheri]|nr:hypothetical protein Bbelb_381690 [Branchiostoma belcheri]